MGQSSKWLHFGLGKYDEIDRVIVRWPGGITEHFTDLKANRHYTIAQGSGQARPWSRPKGVVGIATSQNKFSKWSEPARIQLRYRIPMPSIEYESLSGSNVTVGRQVGQEGGSPTLVSLWASWCQPCLTELADFRKHEERLRAARLNIGALSVDKLAEDQASNPTAVVDFLAKQKSWFESGFATGETIGKFEAALYYLFDFQRHWAVPTSFLLDRRGQLAVIYLGPIDVERLIADVNQLSLGNEAWFEASRPFEGRWLGKPRHPNLPALVGTFFDRGFASDALRLVDQYANVLVADPDSSPLFVRLALALHGDGHVARAKKRFEQATQADPRNAVAHLQLGKLLAQQRQMAEAITHFQRAVELLPHLAEPRMSLGRAYAVQENWAEAIGQFQKATEIDPGDAGAHGQLARALQKIDRLKEAVPVYERALQLDPTQAQMHYLLATASIALGDTETAIEQLRAAHKLKPESLVFLNGLAWILATMERSGNDAAAEALQLAERAARKTDYSHPQVLDTLAAAYAASGDFGKAV